MMNDAANELDVYARIRRLEDRRSELWSVAGGAGWAARVCQEVLSCERAPSQAMLAEAGWCPIEVVAAYRERLAERLAVNAIARAHAKAITLEIRKLRSLSMKRCPEAV